MISNLRGPFTSTLLVSQHTPSSLSPSPFKNSPLDFEVDNGYLLTTLTNFIDRAYESLMRRHAQASIKEQWMLIPYVCMYVCMSLKRSLACSISQDWSTTWARWRVWNTKSDVLFSIVPASQPGCPAMTIVRSLRTVNVHSIKSIRWKNRHYQQKHQHHYHHFYKEHLI